MQVKKAPSPTVYDLRVKAKAVVKKDIPYEAQIIRVADEFDAIVSKRQYKSHIGIVDTLKIVFKDSAIGIKEKIISPFYSIGIVLKEMKVSNTDTNWESHFIERNIEKNLPYVNF